MKKLIKLLLIVTLALSLAACGSEQKNEDVTIEPPSSTPSEESTKAPTPKEDVVIRIATLAGPTGMGLVNLVNDTSGKYAVEVLTQPDQLSPKIISGEVDVATIPSNLAAVLYNKMQGGITVVAVNTKGVLYLLGTDESILSFEDLDGKEVVLTGQGASPEYIVNDLLSKNNASPNIRFMTAHADLSNAMASGDIDLAILPEPFVSITLAQNKDLKVLVDLNEEWKALYGEDIEIPLGVTIVNNAFLKNNEEAFNDFITDYQSSVDFVNTDSDNAAKAIVEAGIFPKEAIVKLAIPRSGITFESPDATREMLEAYFKVLFENNPKSVGGSLPDDAFYYE